MTATEGVAPESLRLSDLIVREVDLPSEGVFKSFGACKCTGLAPSAQTSQLP